MTDAARAARILHGIERILDERTTPIPPRVMQQALRVVRGALEGPMTAERRAVEAAIREPQPAQPARQGRPPKSPEERLAAKRARQAAWKREKEAKLRAAKLEEAAQPQASEAPAPAQALPVEPGPRREVTPPLNAEQRAARLAWLRGLVRALKQERTRQGITVTAAARAIGVTPSELGNLLGKTSASEATSTKCEFWLDVHAPDWRAGQSASPAPAAPPAVSRVPAGPQAPTPPQPPVLGQLEPVPASMEDAQNWLYEELVRERGKRANHTEIEQRLAVFTPKGLLDECNTRRLKHGLPPYVINRRAA